MVGVTPTKLALYWHTLKWLRPVQWRYRFKNTFKSQFQRRFPGVIRRRIERNIPVNIGTTEHSQNVQWFVRKRDGAHGMFSTEDVLKGQYTFLNNSKIFDGEVEWNNPEFSYLWDFNLHYFEYLDALISSGDDSAEATVDALITAWIDKNPCPTQPGWHPYPISLRTINWIKLFVNHPEFAHTKSLRSLYSQVMFLERNIERHLQVNHLLENGRALLFAGIFFEGQDSQRWFDKGMRILTEEIEEQYLPRGGHFERSPMYHCILTEGLLDTYVYITSSGHDAKWLNGPLQKMCEWLENIQCPDGTFPLFNDAAMGISATPREILENAESMVGYERKKKHERVRDCDQFFVLDSDTFFCVVDGAPVGPDYNSGHAHSDNFTFDLFFRGQPLVVDTGTFSYDVNSERVASRSTGAHNTVIVNGLEQSEMWGGFRVAKRSNPTYSQAGIYDNNLVFRGKYTNRVAPSQRITHERIIVVRQCRWMLVWDTIDARCAIEAESICRFAPEWTPSQESNRYSVQHPEQENVFVYPIQTNDIKVSESNYFPEFGRSVPVQQMSFMTSGSRHVESGYLFSLDSLSPEETPRVEYTNNVINIYMNNERVSIELLELSS